MSTDHEKMKKELEKLRLDEEVAAAKAAQERLQAQRNAARNDELTKNAYTTSSQGQTVENWVDVVQRADAAINADVMAYNDWRAAMMGLITLYSALNNAIYHSLNATFVAPLKNTIADAIKDKAIYPLCEAVKRVFTGDPALILPALQHFVDYTDDAGLTFDLERSDDVALDKNGHLTKLFEKGIVHWLSECGYTPVQGSTKKFTDGTQELTAEKFKELKDDPHNGLNQYLIRESELSFRPKSP